MVLKYGDCIPGRTKKSPESKEDRFRKALEKIAELDCFCECAKIPRTIAEEALGRKEKE